MRVYRSDVVSLRSAETKPPRSVHRLDEPAELSLSMVVSPQCRFVKNRPPRDLLSRIESSRPSLRCLILLNRGRGFSDHIQHEVRLGHMGTWLLSVSKTVAPMRFATKRSNSGCIVRSFVATMYQLGFDLHAVPSTFCVNKSATGAA